MQALPPIDVLLVRTNPTCYPLCATMTLACHSEEHRAYAEYTHRNAPDPHSPDGLSQCAMNCQILEDCARMSKCGGIKGLIRGVPNRTKVRWETLQGRTWEDEYGSFKTQLLMSGAQGCLRHATVPLAYPLTILWALEKMNASKAWTRKASLRIDVSTHVSLSMRAECISLHE